MFNLRKLISLTLLTALLVFCSVSSAKALELNFEEDWLGEKPEWAPDISFSNTFLTKYIWRGQNLGDDPVYQFDLSASKYGFTFDLWGSYDTGVEDQITELDYTIDYSTTYADLMEMMDMEGNEYLDPLGFSVGYTFYTFPNVDWDEEGSHTHEMYASVSYDTFLQPFFTWYWDIGNGKGNADGGGNGSYFLAGIGHSFEFEEGISVNLGATCGYNDEQWTNKSGWSDMVFSADVSVPFLNYFTFTPSVAYSVILEKDTYNDEQTNEFYGGFTIGFDY